jgi:hypothetical protein
MPLQFHEIFLLTFQHQENKRKFGEFAVQGDIGEWYYVICSLEVQSERKIKFFITSSNDVAGIRVLHVVYIERPGHLFNAQLYDCMIATKIQIFY